MVQVLCPYLIPVWSYSFELHANSCPFLSTIIISFVENFCALLNCQHYACLCINFACWCIYIVYVFVVCVAMGACFWLETPVCLCITLSLSVICSTHVHVHVHVGSHGNDKSEDTFTCIYMCVSTVIIATCTCINTHKGILW